ncbi:MAG: endonuclease [Alphaproteobacteria bacterium]|nr:MAG: endonuclease [Alphaproteobacteria bacterium]
MRRIADGLDADVVGFHEAESLAAAERMFEPEKYDIVMKGRLGGPSGSCGEANSTQTVIRQAVGFAIRKGLAFDRNPGVTSLMMGTPQQRSGVDTLRAPGHAPIRLLGIHLRSGCFAGSDARAARCCSSRSRLWRLGSTTLRAVRFAVLGDWNHRLGLSGDRLWTEIHDDAPANADLPLADAGNSPLCDPRYDSFIGDIVLDRRGDAALGAFSETPYAPGEKHYSDHCPVAVTLTR